MDKQLPDGESQRGARILVVDDDESVLEYLSHFLGAAGYDVVTATSAERALFALQQECVRIVILDVIMPGMDGLALCRTIRSQSYSDYIYLMLHTSKTTVADIVDGRAAGADDYIGKGASKDQIIERIRTAERFLSPKRGL
jgi:DNA-binding response OmpR family regulator